MTWLLYFAVLVAFASIAFVIGYAFGRDSKRALYVDEPTPTINSLPRMSVATAWRRKHTN